MIRVADLQKRFGAVTAVDGVTFEARDGAITGLLGPNGAGKTTTLRMLYGVMQPDAGRIAVDDVDAVRAPQEAQARLGVLPDGFGLYPRLTAREHIRYFGELQGIAGAALHQRTKQSSQVVPPDKVRVADSIASAAASKRPCHTASSAVEASEITRAIVRMPGSGDSPTPLRSNSQHSCSSSSMRSRLRMVPVW